ncbi:MAG: GIY-YIG nuclease family protein [bacterium]|nr:GIY-YIG nuclease family protein [bacterium]
MLINIDNLPQSPGIYLFYCRNKLVYVGKATSLKNRVRSYFSKSSKNMRPIEAMIHEVSNIKHIETESVLEAILLEGQYIKKYRPKYNVLWKDDKSWNYIVISKDNYPTVSALRQHERNSLTKVQEHKMYSYIFGPYPGLKVGGAMKILSRLFYISHCKPNAKRHCLYYEMGQCLGVCIGGISPSQYKQKVIKPLVMFLRGKKKNLIKKLEREMKLGSTKENFEEAGRVRDQISALHRIHDVTLINKSFLEEQINKKHNIRIEGYDISNLGSTDKVGSMVVFDEGGPIKSEYRKFSIKTVEGQSDVDCLDEVLSRRLNHDEWPMPQVILVDGGKPQVNRARRVLTARGVYVPIVGIAKGSNRDKNEFFLTSKSQNFLRWFSNNKDLLIQVRDEAHRFAIKFNRSKRKIK